MSDKWDFYPCRIEDNPASVFVDLGIRDEVPIADLTEMIWLRLFLVSPREDGMTTPDEFDRLCEIEDALTRKICAANVRIEYVGRTTWGGHRDFFFYSSNGFASESVLGEALVPFSKYEFETGCQPDPNWSVYKECLYPSPHDYQLILNRQVLESLERHGDDHSIEREVTHWLYFKDAESRDGFTQAAKSKGFSVIDRSDTGPGDRPFKIVVANMTAVDYPTINDVVLQVFDLGEEFDGDYDGWETSVEKKV